jgi:hypothetical protein
VSRPKGTETPIDPGEVEKLASIGATQSEMAHWFGVSISTIEKRLRRKLYRGVVEKGKARLAISLRRKQVQLAEEGNPTMLIWLGKQVLGQRDSYSHRLVDVSDADRSLLNFHELDKLVRAADERDKEGNIS